MKKILLLTGMIFITDAALARSVHTPIYVSIKAGLGDTTIYVDNDTKLGDFLVEDSGNNKYDASGLLTEFSTAFGVDATMNSGGWFHLRLEGELGYNYYYENGNIKDYYTVTNEIKVKLNQFSVLVNGYADFRIDNVTPYIGIGLGYGFGKNEITVSNTLGEFRESATDNGILYALHLGMAYRFSDVTTLDLGARRVYAPAEDDGQYVFDSIRLGLRFRI